MDEIQEKIRQLLAQATPDTRQVIAGVFAIERTKLYMSAPHGIVDEIVDAVKEAIR